MNPRGTSGVHLHILNFTGAAIVQQWITYYILYIVIINFCFAINYILNDQSRLVAAERESGTDR